MLPSAHTAEQGYSMIHQQNAPIEVQAKLLADSLPTGTDPTSSPLTIFITISTLSGSMCLFSTGLVDKLIEPQTIIPISKPVTFLAKIIKICQNCYIFAPKIRYDHYDNSRTDIRLCILAKAAFP